MQQDSGEHAYTITTLDGIIHNVMFILTQHGECPQATILSYLFELLLVGTNNLSIVPGTQTTL